MNTNPSSRRLFTFEFFALCAIIVMAFSNVCVFYSFYYYLGVIDIPVVWRGFLVGLEPMAAFALRLFVVPWLHMRNAYAITMVSLALLVAVSCSYLWVTTVAGLIVLRIIHGTVFVLLTSAAISLVVNFIPAEKSGQGFSSLSIAALIPYAIIPPSAEALMPFVRSAADIYAGVSVFSVAGIVLMLILHRRITEAIGRMDAVLMKRLRLSEIRENFRQRPVLLLLAAVLFIYLANATFFYFMKNLSIQTAVGNVGVFFTISMASMIAVRLFGVALFERLDKIKILLTAVAMLTACLFALPAVRSAVCYYALAVVYGGCLGITVPMINALLFSASAPGMRSLNTNMTLFAMDAGYFLTPYLGGALIALGASFGMLFYAAAVCALICLALILSFGYKKKGGTNDESGK